MPPKGICTAKEVYIRSTDENMDSSRSKDERLTVSKEKDGYLVGFVLNTEF